uniref:Putative secreted protein n=1 Tax=Ixodes ricinus TaxID=34613 RepID=A0A6B0U1V5_IXORI
MFIFVFFLLPEVWFKTVRGGTKLRWDQQKELSREWFERITAFLLLKNHVPNLILCYRCVPETVAKREMPL